MPYEWITPTAGEDDDDDDAPRVELHLWPHRSLPRRGFAAFIGLTFALMLLPLLEALGTDVLWALLPFLMGTLALLWWAIERNYRDAELIERLRIWEDRVRLERRSRRASPQNWEANPHWVEVRLHETGGPVANYVTLRGGGRLVEIGAFLGEDERVDLYRELTRYLPAKR